MIYELRTYTLKPGAQAEYLRVNKEYGRPIRGDRFGKFEAGWTTDIGPLNRYVHLWSYADPNAREEARSGLAQDPAWNREYLPRLLPLIEAQENKILKPVDGMPFTPPSDGGKHLYERRSNRTHLQKVPEWVKHFVAVQPVRQKYSKPVALWTADVGQLNQVVHLWPYRDLNHRAEVRAQVAADPGWQEFLAAATPLLAAMESQIMVPTEPSPLQ
jgi:NIPSNAP protein